MTPSLPDRTIVLGHRGSSAHAGENTIDAYRLAIEQGGAGVELDVRRTRDGVLVLHHDPEIEGIGPIIESDAVALPDSVATLEEGLAACRGALVNVEVKNSPEEPDWDPDDGVAKQLGPVLSDLTDVDIVVSSFNPATVAAVGTVAPDLARGLLLLPGAPVIEVLPGAAGSGLWALNPHWSSLDASIVGQVHDAGLVVITWTIDDPDAIRRLAEWGVDAVISNDVAGAVAALAQG